MELQNHFAIVIYPFMHSMDSQASYRRINHRWRLWASRLEDPPKPNDPTKPNDPKASENSVLQRALDDSLFFLPSVRSLLFPETFGLSQHANPDQAKKVIELAALPIDEVYAKFNRGQDEHAISVMKLTYDRGVDPGLFERIELNAKKYPYTEQFYVSWIDAYLFPQRVGFLALKVSLSAPRERGEQDTPTEPGPTDAQLNELLYTLRLVHPPSITWDLACWKIAQQGQTTEFETRDLIDYLLQGMTPLTTKIDENIPAFMERQRDPQTRPSRYTSGDEGQVFGQSLRAYMYVCPKNAAPTPPQHEAEVPSQAPTSTGSRAQAFRTVEPTNGESWRRPRHPWRDKQVARLQFDALADLARHVVTLNEREDGGDDDGGYVFRSEQERVRYELATLTRTKDPNNIPHRKGYQKLIEQGHVALWATWEGMFLHDNILFMATTCNGFTLNALPHNVQNDYFNMYLLTLYQKIRLSVMLGEGSLRSVNLEENLRDARNLWKEFIAFRSHYWLAEVTFKVQGAELYRRYQAALGLPFLYQSISDEVSELQSYFESKAQRNTSRYLNVLTFFGLPITIILTIYNEYLAVPRNLVTTTILVVMVVVAAGAGFVMMNREKQ